jgi:serine/threonine-protein kinase
MRTETGALVGTVVGGSYKVHRLIGSGGMGEVYAATGKAGESVAIKVLHDRAAQDPDLVARFQREASIAARVESPYVASIVGAGKDRNGRLWIAFEQLEGEGLDARLKREHYLAFGDVAPVIDDALQGLIAAHAAGVIHRDIKPANLFVEKRRLTPAQVAQGELEERTRILDFGVSKMRAKAGRKSEPSLTAFDATLGSFAYMAPEQVRGSARVDERADLYALGAVAFRALTGRLPFEGQNAMTLLALKLDREPPSLAAATGDEWPTVIERYLERMMARDKDRRYTSATEALHAWRSACSIMGDRPSPRKSQRPSVPPDDGVDDRTEVTEGTFATTANIHSRR